MNRRSFLSIPALLLPLKSNANTLPNIAIFGDSLSDSIYLGFQSKDLKQSFKSSKYGKQGTYGFNKKDHVWRQEQLNKIYKSQYNKIIFMMGTNDAAACRNNSDIERLQHDILYHKDYSLYSLLEGLDPSKIIICTLPIQFKRPLNVACDAVSFTISTFCKVNKIVCVECSDKDLFFNKIENRAQDTIHFNNRANVEIARHISLYST